VFYADTLEGFAMFLKRLGVATLLTALTVSASAETVSFMVIETGIQGETPTLNSSLLWEYALLDVFFNTGHIVSNAPILRVAGKPQQDLPEEAKASLDEALEGGAEYFVLAVLDYQDSARTGTNHRQPRNVSLRVFKTMPYRFLYSRDYAAPDYSGTEKDEVSNAMDLARVIAAHLSD
jgi:hypothetical protein